MNERLQRLRELLKMQWGELATHLGISRSMLDFVRKGERNLSFPAIRRLEEAERAAGILPPEPPAPSPAPAATEPSSKNLKISEKGEEPEPNYRSIMKKLDAMQAQLEELKRLVGGK